MLLWGILLAGTHTLHLMDACPCQSPPPPRSSRPPLVLTRKESSVCLAASPAHLLFTVSFCTVTPYFFAKFAMVGSGLDSISWKTRRKKQKGSAKSEHLEDCTGEDGRV